MSAHAGPVPPGEMFDELTTMEAAALLEEIRGACEVRRVSDAPGAWYTPGTFEAELHALRMELRDLFIRKFFEVPA